MQQFALRVLLERTRRLAALPGARAAAREARRQAQDRRHCHNAPALPDTLALRDRARCVRPAVTALLGAPRLSPVDQIRTRPLQDLRRNHSAYVRPDTLDQTVRAPSVRSEDTVAQVRLFVLNGVD
jgi:hypothetical protein